MKGFIYIVRNDINDKVYIGKTLLPTIEERFKEHIKDSKRKRCEKRPLYNAINKYGEEHFYIELVEECSADILSEREKYWINFYSSYSKGYNATLGGDGSSLYNYDDMVKAFCEGKLVTQIAKEFECDNDTVRKALLNSGIEDTRKNQYIANSKNIQMIDKTTLEVLKTFDKIEDAAQYMIDLGKAKGTLRSAAAAIGRVTKGEKDRKTAYGYK